MRIDLMNADVLLSIIETLPLEITVIDANDEVIGWNKDETRLFHRPMSSMGLNFRQCHPAESLHMVERIVDDMRQAKRDTASFWIDMTVPYDTKKHKILIEFFALRDQAGNYLGCMECARDVQDIRDLQGEKRLLD